MSELPIAGHITTALNDHAEINMHIHYSTLLSITKSCHNILVLMCIVQACACAMLNAIAIDVTKGMSTPEALDIATNLHLLIASVSINFVINLY